MDTQAQPALMAQSKQANALPAGTVRNAVRPQLQSAPTPNSRAAGNDNRISVDPLRRYKPDPAVYQLAVDRLKLGCENIGFVSANGWDASGAKSFGFQVFWINRGGLPAETSGFAPDHVLSDLSELL